MIKLGTKLRAKVRGFILLTSMLIIQEKVSAKIYIGEVSKPIYSGAHSDKDKKPLTYDLCKNWILTSQQVKEIFEMSHEYPDDSIILRDYYWLPCDIKGWLIYDGVIMNFSLNAAATAEWYDHKTKKYIFLGCDKKRCEEYFLLPYNKMGDGLLVE